MHGFSDVFLERLLELAAARDIVTIFDEIYTGLYRISGFSVAHALRRTPDLLVLGKSLTNGFPLSCVTGSRDLVDRLPTGAHTSTFSAHPVSCAAGLAVLLALPSSGIDEKGTNAGGSLARCLQEAQANHHWLGRPRRRGMALAFDCVTESGEPSPAGALTFARAALAQGLILRVGGWTNATVKLTPPVALTEADTKALCQLLERSAQAASLPSQGRFP